MKPIIIFTDGSSRGNPGPGGWGAIVAEGESVHELSGREEKTTNNRMELSGALHALAFLVDEKVALPDEIKIHTDSSYLIQGITKWVKGWMKNEWMTAAKEPVSNQDLWEKLVSVVDRVEKVSAIEWVHLKGHSGIPGNERVDELATAAADETPIKLFNGARRDYSIDLHAVSRSRTRKSVSTEKKARTKTKAFSYLSFVGGKIETHATWAECEKRVKGVSGAKFKKSVSVADEKEIIAAWRASA